MVFMCPVHGTKTMLAGQDLEVQCVLEPQDWCMHPCVQCACMRACMLACTRFCVCVRVWFPSQLDVVCIMNHDSGFIIGIGTKLLKTF